MESINTVSLSLDDEDRWGWVPEKGEEFTIKSTYRIVSNLTVYELAASPWHAPIFTSVWKCPTPSKVSGFVWQLLHGRVPTQNNLITRRVLAVEEDVSCALCGEEKETELHLFLYCEIAVQKVWMEIFYWLYVPFGLPHNLFSILHCLLEAGNSKIRNGMIMICTAVVWHLWRCQNSLFFDNGTRTIKDLLQAVKISSWKWWMSRSSSGQCLFYEWCAEPRPCLSK
jgi:hypothetical protein